MLRIIDEVVEGKASECAVSLDDLAREGARQMLVQALHVEVAEYIDRYRTEWDEDGRALVSRSFVRAIWRWHSWRGRTVISDGETGDDRSGDGQSRGRNRNDHNRGDDQTRNGHNRAGSACARRSMGTSSRHNTGIGSGFRSHRADTRNRPRGGIRRTPEPACRCPGPRKSRCRTHSATVRD